MLFSATLSTPHLTTEVEPGSLVFIPKGNEWAIGLNDGGLFALQSRQRSNAIGAVADFGQRYEIQIDPATASSVTYPWFEDEVAIGDLVTSLENGVSRCSIVLGRDFGSGQLAAIDIRAGEFRQLGSNVGGVLAYKFWQIDLRRSDAPGDMVTIFPQKVQGKA